MHFLTKANLVLSLLLFHFIPPIYLYFYLNTLILNYTYFNCTYFPKCFFVKSFLIFTWIFDIFYCEYVSCTRIILFSLKSTFLSFLCVCVHAMLVASIYLLLVCEL